MDVHIGGWVKCCRVFTDGEGCRRSRAAYIALICATRREKMFYPSRVRRLLFDFVHESKKKAHRAITGGSADYTLKVSNLVNRTVLCSLEGHTGGVNCVEVFADGTRAISGSDDRTLKVWNLVNQTVLWTLEGHDHWVTCCDVFADGTRALSGGADDALIVWNLSDGMLLRTLGGQTNPNHSVINCAVFADGTRAIGGGVSIIRIWNIADGTLLQTLACGSRLCVLFAQGTRVLCGGDVGTFRVWNLADGTLVRTLEGHRNMVTCCKVSTDGTRAIIGSSDGTFKVWDLTTGTLLRDLRHGKRSNHALPARQSIASCAVFADNDTRTLVTGHGKTLKVWDLARESDDALAYTLSGLNQHRVRITFCEVFAEDTRAITCDGVGRMCVWDLLADNREN